MNLASQILKGDRSWSPFSLCLFYLFLFGCDFRFHRFYQFSELFFAFLARFRVDIVAFPLAVGIGWCVPSLVEVVVNHGDTARPGLSYFGLVRREFDRGGIFPFLPRYRRHLGVCTADFAVNMHCRLPLHSIGNMAVNIKRG